MDTNREIYNNIAESWYSFRHYSRFTAELNELVQRWHGGTLLNVGCAHGPDFLPFKEKFDLYGLDFSEAMTQQARKYADKFSLQVQFTVADAASLPFMDASFDRVIAVATYHHIQDEMQRSKAFRELRRVLKPGAEAFITVWNRNQLRFWFKPKDNFVPWKTGDKIYNRFYYLFTYWELARYLKESNLAVIKMYPESSYKFPLKYFSRNICVLVKAV